MHVFLVPSEGRMFFMKKTSSKKNTYKIPGRHLCGTGVTRLGTFAP